MIWLFEFPVHCTPDFVMILPRGGSNNTWGMANVHINGNWSEDNHVRRERGKVGGKDQSTSDVLFSYPPKKPCPYF